MLRRATKIQLILFIVITLVGISYVSAEYIGLTKGLFSSPCTISADFPDSGGIFSNAEVTYRGVTVGRVGELHLIDKGLRVDLNLDDCDSPRIPASTAAAVADRSVVGEQYVDLVPPNGHGPYVHPGTVIPMSRNSVPTATQTLLVDLDKLVNSVNLDHLQTTVEELGKAFDGRGQDLGTLLDATDQLLKTARAPANVDATIGLIDNASTVLSTQLDVNGPLRSWTHSLKLLTGQLKSSDPDIRHLLNTGPGDVATVRKFITDNRTDLGVTLANLSTVGDLVVRHLDAVEEILELYPALAAGGPTALHDRKGALSLVTAGKTPQGKFEPQLTDDPPDCGDPKKGGQGYSGTNRREPNNTAPIAPNVAARCTAPLSSGINVRGAAHVPGGDPISATGGGYAYPRVITRNVTKGAGSGAGTKAGSAKETVPIGTSLLRSSSLGDASWVALLTDALH